MYSQSARGSSSGKVDSSRLGFRSGRFAETPSTGGKVAIVSRGMTACFLVILGSWELLAPNPVPPALGSPLPGPAKPAAPAQIQPRITRESPLGKAAIEGRVLQP